MIRPAARLGVVAAFASAWSVALVEAAAADEMEGQKPSVIFARDHSLYQVDTLGKDRSEAIATLPAAARDVRALRTDAGGKVLLADIAGTWWWMPLDRSTTELRELPCRGQASLAIDGSAILCANAKDRTVVVPLSAGAPTELAVPAFGAALVGSRRDRRVIWSDDGIWSAPLGKLADRTVLAPDSPVRILSVAPDGRRAFGVYTVPAGSPTSSPKVAEFLYSFALDGLGARRKTLRDGVPVMWSHDSQWVLVQDGTSACIVRAVGGQYKCWRGFTAVSIAPDGAFALVLGPRADGGNRNGKKSAKTPVRDGAEDTGVGEVDHASVELPTGPLSLYRAQLAGAFADPPIVIERVVDGAAVWLP